MVQFPTGASYVQGVAVNVLDIALIIGALGVAAMTFTQAPITTAADILACYAATILAGALYQPVAALPVFTILPLADQTSVTLGIFTALLVGGVLLLRRFARWVTGGFSVSRLVAGPLLGNAVAAALSVLLALTVLLVAVVAIAAVAEIPSGAGLPTLLREEAANSALLPRLAAPLDIYLRLVGVWFGGTTPAVFTDVAAVLHPF